VTTWCVDLSINTVRPIVPPEICQRLQEEIGHRAAVGNTTPLGDLSVSVHLDADSLPGAVMTAAEKITTHLARHQLEGWITEAEVCTEDEFVRRTMQEAQAEEAQPAVMRAGRGRHRKGR
jgi:hypothetical protein